MVDKFRRFFSYDLDCQLSGKKNVPLLASPRDSTHTTYRTRTRTVRTYTRPAAQEKLHHKRAQFTNLPKQNLTTKSNKFSDLTKLQISFRLELMLITPESNSPIAFEWPVFRIHPLILVYPIFTH